SESLNDFLHHLLHCQVAGVYRHVSLCIVFLARPKHLPNSRRPVTALQQRPLPAFFGAAQKDLRSRRKANQKTLFPKQSKILLIDHDTTAGCDHLLSLKQNLCERPLLRSAKIAPPLPAEDVFNL